MPKSKLVLLIEEREGRNGNKYYMWKKYLVREDGKKYDLSNRTDFISDPLTKDLLQEYGYITEEQEQTK